MRAASSRSRSDRAGRTFDNVLVCASPRYAAALLLRQAILVVAPTGAAVRILELPERQHGVEPARSDALEGLVESLAGRGVRLRREMARDTSGRAILGEVIAGRHDLVLKGVELSDHGGRTLEPLDLELVRRCPCPVWAVECRSPRPPGRIVAALDPSSDDERRRARAVGLATLAAAVADAARAELHVLHAWTAFGDHLLRPRMPERDLEAYERRARDVAAEALARTLAAAGVELDDRAVHLPKGHFPRALTEFVEERDMDLVVMGTRGRTDWLESVVRPHAETVLCSTRASAMVVKEDGV